MDNNCRFPMDDGQCKTKKCVDKLIRRTKRLHNQIRLSDELPLYDADHFREVADDADVPQNERLINARDKGSETVSRNQVGRNKDENIQADFRKLEKKLNDVQWILNAAAKLTRCCTDQRPQCEVVQCLRTLSTSLMKNVRDVINVAQESLLVLNETSPLMNRGKKREREECVVVNRMTKRPKMRDEVI